MREGRPVVQHPWGRAVLLRTIVAQVSALGPLGFKQVAALVMCSWYAASPRAAGLMSYQQTEVLTARSALHHYHNSGADGHIFLLYFPGSLELYRLTSHPVLLLPNGV
jgi:hypothetical protein